MPPYQGCFPYPTADPSLQFPPPRKSDPWESSTLPFPNRPSPQNRRPSSTLMAYAIAMRNYELTRTTTISISFYSTELTLFPSNLPNNRPPLGKTCPGPRGPLEFRGLSSSPPGQTCN